MCVLRRRIFPEPHRMRNMLAPGYFDIAREIVWEAATRDVPALWKMIRLVHTLEPASLSERRKV